MSLFYLFFYLICFDNVFFCRFFIFFEHIILVLYKFPFYLRARLLNYFILYMFFFHISSCFERIYTYIYVFILFFYFFYVPVFF